MAKKRRIKADEGLRFISSSGIELELSPITNTNALQSLANDAGLFDRSKRSNDIASVLSDWNKLMTYCFMNGVATHPTDEELEEIVAMGYSITSPRLRKLYWLKYGQRDGVDVLAGEEDATNLMIGIMQLSFSAQKDEPDTEE